MRRPVSEANSSVRRLLSILAVVPILALGLYDDRWGVGPWVKLAIQACAALTLTLFGYGVPLLTDRKSHV